MIPAGGKARAQVVVEESADAAAVVVQLVGEGKMSGRGRARLWGRSWEQLQLIRMHRGQGKQGKIEVR